MTEQISYNSNLLAIKFPQLRHEFLYCLSKNGEKDESRTFNTLTHGSHSYAMWKCPKTNCEKKCEHIYKSTINHRSSTKKGCPFCCGLKICHCNSFATKQPILTKEWGENGSLQPFDIAEFSNQTVQWRCSKSTCQHAHIWNASVCNRSSNKRGCPYCSGRRVCPCNSFASKQPDLTKEWGKNNTLNPENVTEKSENMIEWKCSKAKCEHHVWKATPSHRVSQRSGCPYCSNLKTCECYCLASEFSELLNAEWDELKNDEEGLDMFKLAPYSNKYAWWLCKTCKHSWYSTIINRTKNGRGCPKCSASKMEKSMLHILQIFETKNIILSFISEWRLYPTKMYADFCITTVNNERIIIETDGIQHFTPQAFGSGSRTKEEMFQEVQKNDRRKKEWCEKNNIRLLRISYLVKPEDYEVEVQDFVKNKNVTFRLVGKPI